MEPVRSLRELFASMSHDSGDPAATLAQAGHGDLPGHLVTEAIISYADSAPVEVAEHLAPYVTANSAVPAPDGHAYPVVEPDQGLALLSSAPAVDNPTHDDPFDDHVDHRFDDHPADHLGLPHVLDDHLPDHTLDGPLDQGSDHLATVADHDPAPVHDDAHHGDDGPADLWFGHGQAAALADDPGAYPDADHFADAGHADPWLVVPGAESLPGESTLDGLDAWHAEPGHQPLPAADQPVEPGHHADSLDEPGDHDAIDPGHA